MTNSDFHIVYTPSTRTSTTVTATNQWYVKMNWTTPDGEDIDTMSREELVQTLYAERTQRMYADQNLATAEKEIEGLSAFLNTRRLYAALQKERRKWEAEHRKRVDCEGDVWRLKAENERLKAWVALNTESGQF